MGFIENLHQSGAHQIFFHHVVEAPGVTSTFYVEEEGLGSAVRLLLSEAVSTAAIAKYHGSWEDQVKGIKTPEAGRRFQEQRVLELNARLPKWLQRSHDAIIAQQTNPVGQ